MFDNPDADSIGEFVTRIALGSAGSFEDIVASISAIRDREQCADVLHRELFALPVFNVDRHRALLCVVGQLGENSSLAVLERFAWLAPDWVLPSRSVLWDGYTAADWSLQARSAQMLAWVAGTGYRDTQLQIIRGHPHAAVRYAAIGSWLFVRSEDPVAAHALRPFVHDGDQWAVTNAEMLNSLSPREFIELVNAQALLTA